MQNTAKRILVVDGAMGTMLQRFGFTEADLRLPLYDSDLEQNEGVPEAVKTLAAQIDAAEFGYETGRTDFQALIDAERSRVHLKWTRQ